MECADYSAIPVIPDPPKPGAVLCDPRKYRTYIYVVSTICVWWFQILELFSIILDRIGSKYCLLDEVFHEDEVNSVGERTVLARSNSISRVDSTELLLGWLEVKPIDGMPYCYYESKLQMWRYIIQASVRTGYIRFLCSLVLRNQDISVPLNKLAKTFTCMKREAQKSVKFRFLFKKFIKWLEHTEKGKVEDMIQMIHYISEDIYSRPTIWLLEFEHRLLRCGNVEPTVYETSLAMMSLFFSYGGNIDQHGLAQCRESPRKMHDCMLALFMISALERCSSGAIGEINVTEYGEIGRILLSNWKEGFHLRKSKTTKPDDLMFKDRVMWDMMTNNCCEYFESTWTEEHMQRGVWNLQWGRQFVKKSDYDKIVMRVKEGSTAKLSEMDAHILLACVIGGALRLFGAGDGPYRMLERADAPMEVHVKTLPTVTVQDLLDMRVLRACGKGKFVVNWIPGKDKTYRGVDDGGNISLVPHIRNVSFRARPNQAIQ